MIEDLFDADRAWIGTAPGMTPWEDGTARLRGQLVRWAVRYSGEFCDRAEAEEGALRKLWTCWRFHWMQAREVDPDADGWEVVGRLRRGQGARRRLDGDPLRDVVLAAALIRHDRGALAHFIREYRPFCEQAAAKRYRNTLGARLVAGADDWFPELLDKLTGLGQKPQAALHRFDGRSTLKPWLESVVGQHLRRHLRPSNKRRSELQGHQELEEFMLQSAADGSDSPDSAAAVRECLERLAGGLNGWADLNLSAVEYLVLLESFGGRISREIAALLNKEVKAVSVIKNRAMNKLKGPYKDGLFLAHHRDCIDLLRELHPSGISLVFERALRSYVERKGPS